MGGPTRRYAIAALAILVAGVAYEIVRLFLPWGPNVGYVVSAGVSTSLIVMWSATALSLVRRHKAHRGAQLGWALSFLAPIAMFLHGFATLTVAGSYAGLPYIPAALVVLFCLKRAWQWPEVMEQTSTGHPPIDELPAPA